VKLCYLPLEPYRERYTELLRDWTRRAWDSHCALTIIDGSCLHDNVIREGVVLDAAGRGYWATTQTSALLAWLDRGYQPDVLYFDDAFHPGIEAIPYLFQQSSRPWPAVYVRNWAQSVDVFDFTFEMRAWMRPYEQMLDGFIDGMFVASTCHKEMLQAANFQTPVHVVGLPFDADRVRALAGRPKNVQRPYPDRLPLVVWSSRWDAEKNPLLFLDLARRLQRDGLGRAMICTGAAQLRSNSPDLGHAALAAQADGTVEIHTGLTKQAYYALVADARVHVNTASQDFVSFAVLEASALGTPTVAPAYRSFPEVFAADARRLFIPGNPDDLYAKVHALLTTDALSPDEVWAPSDYHSATFARTLKAMQLATGVD
jgi:glycosyltransferase involved in cell wall biosynthesis